MENQEQNIRSWDDLIFENRNKSYGAYAIRQEYSMGVAKGALTGIGILVSVFIVAGVINGNSPVSLPETDVDKTICVLTVPDIIPIEKTQPVAQTVRSTNANLAPIAVTHETPVEPDPQPTQATAGSTEGTTDGTATADTGTSTGAIGGTETVVETQPAFFSHVEVMPVYRTGNEGMIKVLKKNLRYPQSARTVGKEGTVFVEFIVNNLGEIQDIKVIRGFDKDCDKEAVRVVGKLTDWKPGLQNKMAVNVKLVLPIKFEMN